ncbi:two-component system OmpR family sensor kinase [Paenibacillus phyllosphaerae]|uniref:histidine kinase n=1 Tax=Paenibacillus phyllosphaerae TaxID=274593 RepID=A0A7W5AVY7_9BACL|nr:HAMP domain-containing sensor histidine kinase [Paenibacillus phyllosphaerae]MBB3109803.1 two-component system OmpR family sensor kinase [Paenibacillus phyllosphaerae]
MKRLLTGPRSLRYQLLFRSILLIAGILLLIGLMQYWLMKGFLYRNKAEALSSQLMSTPVEMFSNNNDSGLSGPPTRERGNAAGPEKQAPATDGSFAADDSNEDVKDTDAAQPADSTTPHRPGRPSFFLSDTSLAYFDADGNFVDLSAEDGLLSPQLPASEYEAMRDKPQPERSQTNYRLLEDAEGNEQLVVFRTVGPPNRKSNAIMQMGVYTTELQDVIMQQLLIFSGLSALALSAGAALLLPLLRRTLVPLSRVVTAVEQTDAGNLTEKLPTSQGQEEIDRLSISFNHMLDRLDASFEAERAAKERMRQFIADASHELRTPLTSIHGFLEILLRGAVTNPDQLRSAIKSMHNESRRINKLVEDLLLLAKLDREPQLTFKEVKLAALLQEMEPQLQVLAGERTVRLLLDEPVQLQLDPDKIKQVILNLFHNAVQHTEPDKGLIEIQLTADDTEAMLAVRDNGSGIGQEHLPRLFERFYRSDSSRTRKYGGAGLGLSISRSIIEAHLGAIEAKSPPGEGAVFLIRLPLDSNRI